MVEIGYHASHEQFTPSALLRYVQQAEQAGFDAGMCSDHLVPWSSTQGESGYAWSWLGAALQATGLSYGTVCAPGYRYHSAIVAQKIATLGELFPGRFWVALASGEAMNESVTGEPWPLKPERNARLRECVDIIRRLLAGETVTHHGLVRVDAARIWTLPTQLPPLFGAALSAETAAECGAWADGLITVAPNPALPDVIDAFRTHGGRGKPIYVQVKHSFAAIEDEAIASAMDQWAPAIVPFPVGQELRLVEQFDALAPLVPETHVRESVVVSADIDHHSGVLRALVDLGIDRLYLHNVGRNQEAFIERFGRDVLPALRR